MRKFREGDVTLIFFFPCHPGARADGGESGKSGRKGGEALGEGSQRKELKTHRKKHTVMVLFFNQEKKNCPNKRDSEEKWGGIRRKRLISRTGQVQ